MQAQEPGWYEFSSFVQLLLHIVYIVQPADSKKRGILPLYAKAAADPAVSPYLFSCLSVAKK
jgi:hypothetical protein